MKRLPEQQSCLQRCGSGSLACCTHRIERTPFSEVLERGFLRRDLQDRGLESIERSWWRKPELAIFRGSRFFSGFNSANTVIQEPRLRRRMPWVLPPSPARRSPRAATIRWAMVAAETVRIRIAWEHSRRRKRQQMRSSARSLAHWSSPCSEW